MALSRRRRSPSGKLLAARQELFRRPTDSFHPALAEDPFSTDRTAGLSRPGSWCVGLVIEAHPHTRWYRVKVSNLQGLVACYAAGSGGSAPLAPRDYPNYPAYTEVLVYLPPGSLHGIIHGSIPVQAIDPRLKFPDWISQGSGVGFLREAYQRLPLENPRASGIVDWSTHAPADDLTYDRTLMNALGVGLTVGSFHAALRVSEACGFFVNWFDGHARVAGLNLDVQAYSWHAAFRNDEGELTGRAGYPVFQHEAAGRYGSQDQQFQQFSAEDVLRKKAKGAVDLPDGEEDVEPFCRRQEFFNYLGQGRLDYVIAPPTGKTTGPRRMRDGEQDHDRGLHRRFVGVDGAALEESVKSITFRKTSRFISTPRAIRVPEDPKGADASRSSYRFAGIYGSGPEHKLPDPDRPTGQEQAPSSVANLLDFVTRLSAWQATLPFHYKTGDWKLPNDSELGGEPQRVDFSVLSTRNFIDLAPSEVQLDPRTSSTKLWDISSIFSLTDDGSVVIQNDYGVRLVLGRGTFRLEAPGDGELVCGNRLVQFAKSIYARADQDVELVADNGSFTTKGQTHWRALGGVDGSGGVVIESKGSGASFDYDGKIGDDVASPGLLLLSKSGPVAALGSDVYLRSGVGQGGGRVTIDCGGGAGTMAIRGASLDAFVRNQVAFWYSSDFETGEAQQCATFSPQGSRVEGLLRATGGAYFGGDVAIGGNLQLTGGIIAKQGVRAAQGGDMGSAENDDVDSRLQPFRDALQEEPTAAAGRYDLQLAQPYDQQNGLASARFREIVGFSFNDQLQSRYVNAEYLFLEPWGEQMTRQGSASGLSDRRTRPVDYQSKPTYPFPGHKALIERQALLKAETLKLYDAGSRQAKDRGAIYEEFEPTTLTTASLLNRPQVVGS